MSLVHVAALKNNTALLVVAVDDKAFPVGGRRDSHGAEVPLLTPGGGGVDRSGPEAGLIEERAQGSGSLGDESRGGEAWALVASVFKTTHEGDARVVVGATGGLILGCRGGVNVAGGGGSPMTSASPPAPLAVNAASVTFGVRFAFGQ